MSYQSKFKRYELKYLLTLSQYQGLKEKMKSYMIPDKFSISTINNIYYDTEDNILIRRSLERPLYKEKLRVRSYGYKDESSTVFVELKKKFKGVVYKRRIDMTYKESNDYLLNNVKPLKQSQITHEIDYFFSYYKGLKPSMAIAYNREAFVSITDPDFRMTFDQNILARNYDLSIDCEICGEKILPENTVLLEIKTSMGMPLWLMSYLSSNSIFKTSFSKYGAAYEQIILKKKIGGKTNVA